MKTFLFDLDSTLLQMNQDEFVEAYFKSIARYSYTLGYNPKEFMEIFNKAAYAIIKNDGSMTNEDRFWMVIKEKYTDIDFLKKSFDHYYRNEFHELKDHIHKTYHPYELIKYLKDKGYRIILATNPVFPKVATEE
ncbi:MAG: HAD family hydrolase, partial [Acholeplasmatales bacterium]|nr:HAD family hydrolase [Acholeplasmatales bacterium]